METLDFICATWAHQADRGDATSVTGEKRPMSLPTFSSSSRWHGHVMGLCKHRMFLSFNFPGEKLTRARFYAIRPLYPNNIFNHV